MEFLEHLTRREQSRAAVCDTSVTELDGLKLTPEEQATRQNALDMLALYFAGKLPLDVREERYYQKMLLRKYKTVTCFNCGGSGKVEVAAGKFLMCSACGGRRRVYAETR
jgi:DnaJ-class molecular chaperone